MKKWANYYKKWKAYVQVDLIMYASLLLFLLLLFVFFS